MGRAHPFPDSWRASRPSQRPVAARHAAAAQRPHHAPRVCIAWLLFGFPLGYAVLIGFIVGYVGYDMVHYYVHHATPTTRVGRYLRQVHMVHHFRDPDSYFGVSAPYWDVIFGTRRVPSGGPIGNAPRLRAPAFK